ncbi:Glycosyl transferase family 2 [Lachnospiraceae bacterium]|nr:Glycosyl transferase family 2 [Lachnospiraceae bacterium]
MNDKKIAFIIATNDEQYFSECTYYINRLWIPEGFETDVIGVREAHSICEAYNAAMHSSDARYKVYLHHDVFILNQNFIQDVVDSFALDPEVGMLGVIGAVNMPPDAYAFNSWDTGGTLLFNGQSGGISMYSNEEGLTEVSAIDGMIMITNHDLKWREDIFDGWDFYDLSQSMEFWRVGYKVAVPYQKSPWCMHDLAHLGLGKYDHYRKIFCETYHDAYGFEAGTENSNPFEVEESKNIEAAHEIAELIFRDLSHDRFEEVREKLEYVKIYRAVQDNDLEMIRELLTIYDEEAQEGIRCFWTPGGSFGEIREKYIALRFLLYRAEFDCDTDDYIPLLRKWFQKGLISEAAIRVVMNKYIYDSDKVYKKLLAEGVPAGKSEELSGFRCPICGNIKKVLTFQSSSPKIRKHHGFPWKAAAYTGEGNKQIFCAGCGASPEERAAASILKETMHGNDLRVVSLSYLPVLGQWINMQTTVTEYITSEADHTGKREEDELQTFWSLEDRSCDIVIASETFNHCADDKAAMGEIHRILKEDGYLITINSIGIGITDTVEDESVDAEERVLHWQLFGGERNRRCYAESDFINRLIDTGLFVGKVDQTYFGRIKFEEMALPERFQVFVSTKDETNVLGKLENKYELKGCKQISIVLLTDGRCEALRRTIEDVRSQIYPYWEMVIVGVFNGEEQKVLNLVEDKRIRLYESDDVSRSGRRNIGIRETTGDYLAFIKTGDRFERNYMYNTLKLLEADPECVYGYADTLLSENGMGISLICPDENYSRIETSGKCFASMLGKAYPKLSAVIFRRSNVTESGGFEESLGDEGEREFLLRTVREKSIAEVPQVLVTVEVDREDPFINIEDRVNEYIRIISEFQLSKTDPEAYVRNVSGMLAEIRGYTGKCREMLVDRIYKVILKDGFFDETDMESIRDELGM